MASAARSGSKSYLKYEAIRKSFEQLVHQFAASDVMSIADSLISKELLELTTLEEIESKPPTHKARRIVSELYRKITASPEKYDKLQEVLKTKNEPASEILNKNYEGKHHVCLVDWPGDAI